MVKRGSYQGSAWICVVSAKTVTMVPAAIIEPVPIPYDQNPSKRRSWRAMASRPANSTMTTAANPVNSGDVTANSVFSTSPTRVNWTTMRVPATTSLFSSPRRSLHDNPALKTNNNDASPMSQ